MTASTFCRALFVSALALPLLTPSAARAQALPDAAAVARYAGELLDRLSIDTQGPGVAVLVARGDELLLQTARGQASIELGVALSPEQRFRIGSVTKQFSAALLLKLIDEGKAQLDDPLAKFLPRYPNAEAITLAMLLNHTAGIMNFTTLPGFWRHAARMEMNTAEIIDVFKDRPVDFAPGRRWAYNNSGYVLVGAVIEAITGKPWWQGLSTLNAPLFHATPDRLIPRQVSGYARGPDGKPAPAFLVSTSLGHAAGALVGDLQSLWRWNQQLHERGFLTPATYKRMTTPDGAAAEAKCGYGLFIDTLRGQRLIHHDGSVPGAFSSALLYMPAQRVTVAILRNADGGPDLEVIGRHLAAFAAGRPFPQPKPITLAIEELKRLEGVYGQGKDSRTLRVVDDVLTSQRSGGTRVPLMPIGAARFAFPYGEQLLFEQDGRGQVVSARFFVEGDGEGNVWARTGELLQRADITLDAEQKKALVGEYRSLDLQIEIFLDEQGQLMTQLRGQRALPLKAASPRELYLTVVDSTLQFEPAEGPAQSLTLLQGRVRITMQR